ncbi:hypothetical protein [Cupriavidus oxalaticus]|uniref:DUF1488 domain-containing protein n=2 Tax=Cupriavidus TaxID=106589 RepID=A0A375FY39_9BURK|nr:hypothetical protein [Cupriavidus oxalaticus]QEZ46493.1 hypothetical protein D2917_19815 [Cupriavidus oxalaticus]QRQ86036.1 hypothetical protein JTE91_22680 [Cupriavidus oxalaticus]QRQ95637.1 hypothetical protein JTE92_19580 [Cupriavidus oxalaticus]WQD84300.1 hypothetical protein U0036_07295 [Cupriavidus oxalaticus]SPC05521.1 conserved hypothetical protein [Cupriavidus oxalaticus]
MATYEFKDKDLQFLAQGADSCFASPDTAFVECADGHPAFTVTWPESGSTMMSLKVQIRASQYASYLTDPFRGREVLRKAVEDRLALIHTVKSGLLLAPDI